MLLKMILKNILHFKILRIKKKCISAITTDDNRQIYAVIIEFISESVIMPNIQLGRNGYS